MAAAPSCTQLLALERAVTLVSVHALGSANTSLCSISGDAGSPGADACASQARPAPVAITALAASCMPVFSWESIAVQDVLGHGSFGVVLQCRHGARGQQLAIKVPLAVLQAVLHQPLAVLRQTLRTSPRAMLRAIDQAAHTADRLHIPHAAWEAVLAELRHVAHCPAHPCVLSVLGSTGLPVPGVVLPFLASASSAERLMHCMLPRCASSQAAAAAAAAGLLPITPQASQQYDIASQLLICPEQAPRRGVSAEPAAVWQGIMLACRDSALGLAHLHAHGVVHRDIAARNVLVDRRGWACIADFGLARSSFRGALSRAHTVDTTGAWRWEAPECRSVTEGLCYSPASDVWALGCVVVELLTGQPPWARCPSFQHLAMARDAHRQQLQIVPCCASHVATPLVWVAHACLQYEPTARPSAAQLGEVLSAYIGKGPGRSAHDDMPAVCYARCEQCMGSGQPALPWAELLDKVRGWTGPSSNAASRQPGTCGF